MGCGISKSKSTASDVVEPVRVSPQPISRTNTIQPGSSTKTESNEPPSTALVPVVPVIRPVIAVGDTVKITDDVTTLRRLQSGHGGFKDEMRSVLGKVGRVVRVDNDGDLKVEVEGKQWLFNAECCTLVSTSERRAQTQPSSDSNDDRNSNAGGSTDDDGDDVTARIAGRLAFFLILAAGSPIDPSRLVAEAAQGHEENVRAILQRFPNAVNRRQQNGTTAIMAAANQGHASIVAMLLAAGADPEMADDDGDTAYHYAAYGNKPAILAGLLNCSAAPVNAVNKIGQTLLHIAVCSQSEDSVLVLFAHKCKLNIQDKDGDTALHEAVQRDKLIIVTLLLATNEINLSLQNDEGFNVLHLAARSGRPQAVSVLLDKAPASFVNEPKPDGYTALHIAAANGYLLTATILIEKGKANLEAKSLEKRTPLQTAVAFGQTAIIELLVIKGAKLEDEDAQGDTALHNVLLLWKSSLQSPNTFMAFLMTSMFNVRPKDIEKSNIIRQIFLTLGGNSASAAWIAVACFLVSKGANLHHKNKQGVSPLDEVEDPQFRNLLLAVKVH